MSKKKNQLLSEISENLKKTIKKYNELAMDDNLFNEEPKSKTSIFQKSTSINGNSQQKIIKEETNKINNNGIQQINDKDENNLNNFEEHQNNFVAQLNTLMNNLNILEDNINKDFDELENYIENDIEKELLTKQQIS